MILKLRRVLDNQYNLYSVSDGEPGDAANFNSSFVSREIDDSKAAKLDLADSGSSTVTDTQKNIVDEATWSGRILNGASGVPVWVSNVIGLITDGIRERVEAIQGAVETNQTDIGTNATNIATNTTDIGTNDTDIAEMRTTSGTSDGDTDMGTFTGTTLTDNLDIKALLQELETAVEGVGGALQFAGTWDANANTPTLVSSTGTAGEFYIVSTAGTTSLDGISDWQINDWAIYDGTVWRKIDNSELVTSVNGNTGSVTLDLNDINDVNTVGVQARYLMRRNGGNTSYEVYNASETASDAATGTNATLSSPSDKVLVKLTNASLVSIDMIPATFDGHEFVLFNDTGGTVTINDNVGATPAQRITTGTGAPITLLNEAAITLIYDSADATDRWRVVGGSGSGTGGGTGFRNFIATQDSTFEELNTVGSWITFEDTGGYVDGTGGSPATITILTETVSPQVGGRSLEILKAATDATDEGTSIGTEPIDPQFRGRDLQGSIELDFSDALYTSGDAEIRAYDVTNAQELTVINGSIPNNKSKLEFGVIGLESNTVQVRLSVYWQTDSATASTYSCFIDEIKLGDEGLVQGVTFGTDWIPYTPTFTGFGVVTVEDFQYKQDGSDILIRGRFTAGTSTAVEAQITLPGSFVSNADLPAVSVVGVGAYNAAAALTAYTLIEPSVGYLTIGLQDGAKASLTKALGNVALGTGNDLSITARIPVQDLVAGANLPVQVGLEDGIVMIASKNGGSTTANTTIPSWTVAHKDTAGMMNLSTGVATVKQAGNYWAGFTLDTGSSSMGSVKVLVNGTEIIRADAYSGVGASGQIYGLLEDLEVGDLVTTEVSTALTLAGGDTKNRFSLFKIPSPIVNLGTTERVAYLKDSKPAGTDGGTFTLGAWQIRDLNTIEGDQSFVSLSSNQFTLEPGAYEIEAHAPAYGENNTGQAHKAKLRNITDSADEIIGSSENSYSTTGTASTSSSSKIIGKFIISSQKTFEIQHQIQTTVNNFGFGKASSFGVDEIYSQVKIKKVK